MKSDSLEAAHVVLLDSEWWGTADNSPLSSSAHGQDCHMLQKQPFKAKTACQESTEPPSNSRFFQLSFSPVLLNFFRKINCLVYNVLAE